MASAASRYTGRLMWTLVLTGGFMGIEVIGGLWTGSLALLADAGHMLADVGGLSMSLLAAWFAQRPPTAVKTYGYFRTEILAALANGVILFLVAGYILYEAVLRLWTPPAILSGPMLIIAMFGLAVNLVGMGLLHSGAGESLNLRGAYLEVVSDALGSIAVIAAALLIHATGVYVIDPIVSVAIGLFILPRTWGLIRQALNILMEGVPPHLDIGEIEAAMVSVQGVRAVHDLHVWTLTSGKDAMSSHVVVDDLAAGDRILRQLHRLLHERFGIEHTTIQVELESLVQISPPADESPPGSPEGSRKET
ncbi:MAG TPA: cation diffusion facilitator family transporter [Alphaproteobacteria bacterium]|nr:cation diffusion facilitator family transporter [Alphaproteobacteria bacterium]